MRYATVDERRPPRSGKEEIDVRNDPEAEPECRIHIGKRSDERVTDNAVRKHRDYEERQMPNGHTETWA